MENSRGRPFQPGNSFGRGRPDGSRNKATIALQQMLGTHAEAITKKCVVMALQGDTTALRLCIERLLPPCKESAIRLKLPSIVAASDVALALSRVLQAVACGRLTPGQGQALATILEGRRRVIETEELERRVDALEQRGRTGEQPGAKQ